ncbi:MAG TPA: FAD-dependent oxidoreductase, partial [Lacipirellulaceae bacterium]
TWGLAKDEFADNDNWPHQLYVREARRMISDHVMSQSNCQGREVADDSVGLGAYGMDSHNVQRYVDENGHVQNEGDVQVHGFAPYPIAYRSIRPKKSECENLLVPVCLSASHIAYGSIRMEPVFMILGQSAATAAVIAIDKDIAVQAVPYEELEARLLSDGQVLNVAGTLRVP